VSNPLREKRKLTVTLEGRGVMRDQTWEVELAGSEFRKDLSIKLPEKTAGGPGTCSHCERWAGEADRRQRCVPGGRCRKSSRHASACRGAFTQHTLRSKTRVAANCRPLVRCPAGLVLGRPGVRPVCVAPAARQRVMACACVASWHLA